jgi:LDH2 family malate/lactate/ureidoglycolate dehydrogenase
MISKMVQQQKMVWFVFLIKIYLWLNILYWIGDPTILKKSPGTALVDGQNLLGPYVGKYCMNIAMEKARKIGIGLVAVRRSNHFGIAGYYSLKAVEENLIGFAVWI